jgi:hypothetical protein
MHTVLSGRAFPKWQSFYQTFTRLRIEGLWVTDLNVIGAWKGRAVNQNVRDYITESFGSPDETGTC